MRWPRSTLVDSWRYRVLGLLAVAGLWIAYAAGSFGEEPAATNSNADLEPRVRRLEALVSQAAAESAKSSGPSTVAVLLSFDPTEPVEGTENRVFASPARWENGFFLRSDDSSYVLRITGQIQADYRDFLRDGDATDIDGFLVRRARLGIEATMFNYYEFRLLPDFGQGQSRVQDAYLNVHYWDELQFEMGRFKQPFSYEQLIQDRFVPTMERSLIDQLVPGRDVGLMIHGQNLCDGRIDYAVALSNGVINGDFDTNNGKEVAARLAVRPFDGDCARPNLRGLQIGISASTGSPDGPVNPNTLRTPATVPWFHFNPTVEADGVRTRWSPEVSYFNGPFGFAAQYLHEEQELQPRSAGPGSGIVVDVPMDGFYLLFTCLLTGEERTSFSQPITPLVAFDPRCPGSGRGAWEVIARVSRLSVGSEAFKPGPARLADPTTSSSGATEMTLGLNWYLNRWVRAQFNWEHAWFDNPVRLGGGSGGLLDEQDTLLFRCQIIF